MGSGGHRLALALALLLVPTAVVGWVGLSRIGSLESELAASIEREASLALRGAERFCRRRVRRLFEDCLSDLPGLPEDDRRSSVEALLRTPPDAAVLFAFRLDGGGRPIQPRLPERPAGLGTTPDLLAGSPPVPPPLLKVLRDARRVLAAPGLGPEDALSLLDEADAGDDPRARALLALERGRVLSKLGRLKDAVATLAAGRALLEDAPPAPLVAALILAEARARIEALADLGGEEAARERAAAAHLIEGLLADIAAGRYDREHDALLDVFFDEGEELAGRLEDPELELRLDALRIRNLQRAANRQLMAEIEESGLAPHRRRLAENHDELLLLPMLGERRGEVVLIHAYPTVEGGRETAGLLLDLEKLLGPTLADAAAQLSREGLPWHVLLEDETGKHLVGDPPPAPERPGARPLRRALPLAPPLAPLRLVAVAGDARALLARRRRSLLAKAILWVALAASAGVGAFMLVRVFRREREIAALKTEFVSRVSHELKTPLSLIRMYGETIALGRVQDGERTRHFAQIVAEEAGRLTRMIENVLDFSKVERGIRNYEPTQLRLDRLVEDVVASYRPHLEEHGFALEVDALEPVAAEVDPGGFTQALLNLLSNARKYTRDGERRIQVRLKRRGDRAVLEVLDRGVGVPESERERIFDSFYRASTAGEGRGAGIGLALVRHFAEAHGGAAGCRGREGGGSVFWIELPALPDGAPEGER